MKTSKKIPVIVLLTALTFAVWSMPERAEAFKCRWPEPEYLVSCDGSTCAVVLHGKHWPSDTHLACATKLVISWGMDLEKELVGLLLANPTLGKMEPGAYTVSIDRHWRNPPDNNTKSLKELYDTYPLTITKSEMSIDELKADFIARAENDKRRENVLILVYEATVLTALVLLFATFMWYLRNLKNYFKGLCKKTALALPVLLQLTPLAAILVLQVFGPIFYYYPLELFMVKVLTVLALLWAIEFSLYHYYRFKKGRSRAVAAGPAD